MKIYPREPRRREKRTIFPKRSSYIAKPWLSSKWQAGWWFLGTILYDTNEYTGCRDALSHFVELKTDSAPAWGILGLCEFQTGDYARSLKHIDRSFS